MPTEEQMQSAQWHEHWLIGWDDLQQQDWVRSIEEFSKKTFDADELYQKISDYIATLRDMEAILKRTGTFIRENNAPLKYHIKWAELDKKWRDLYAPILADSFPKESFGNPVVVAVVVVGSLALGASACAYAIGKLSDAVTAWEQANAWETTEVERLKRGEAGTPAPWNAPKPPDDDTGMGDIIKGLGALIALGVAANALGAFRGGR